MDNQFTPEDPWLSRSGATEQLMFVRWPGSNLGMSKGFFLPWSNSVQNGKFECNYSKYKYNSSYHQKDIPIVMIIAAVWQPGKGKDMLSSMARLCESPLEAHEPWVCWSHSWGFSPLSVEEYTSPLSVYDQK